LYQPVIWILNTSSNAIILKPPAILAVLLINKWTQTFYRSSPNILRKNQYPCYKVNTGKPVYANLPIHVNAYTLFVFEASFCGCIVVGWWGELGSFCGVGVLWGGGVVGKGCCRVSGGIGSVVGVANSKGSIIQSRQTEPDNHYPYSEWKHNTIA